MSQDNYQLHLGDCLEVMRGMADKSVDAVITDPPYGTTACKWDSVIPFEPMWEQLKRLIKPSGAIALFGSQPFTSALVMSNPEMFKYEWIWEKEQSHTALNAKCQPLKVHENISVFSSAPSTFSPHGTMCYNPQMAKGTPYKSTVKKQGAHSFHSNIDVSKSETRGLSRYPKSVQRSNRQRGLHPTQKPVKLLSYLIRTYTLEGETVLDFTMGSGTTGVACMETGRKFIGIELDPEYFEIAEKRIYEATRQQRLFE
jgi:site-specific DNA-methyltransferase (adenine-specific)